jgi:23S rRNA (pseudouridine1915-N3)-methyltransferase
MKIVLLQVGKTDKKYLEEGIADFVKRIARMAQFEMITVPDLKNRKSLSMKEQMKKEAESISAKIVKGDIVFLLDERGKQMNSIEFSTMLDSLFQGSSKRIIFVIGGPYGFHDDLYSMADRKLSLSGLTFSHQLVRLLFVEQLYRGLTILGGLPYHNE